MGSAVIMQQVWDDSDGDTHRHQHACVCAFMGEARGESERVQGRVLAKACQLQELEWH